MTSHKVMRHALLTASIAGIWLSAENKEFMIFVLSLMITVLTLIMQYLETHALTKNTEAILNQVKVSINGTEELEDIEE